MDLGPWSRILLLLIGLAAWLLYFLTALPGYFWGALAAFVVLIFLSPRRFFWIGTAAALALFVILNHDASFIGPRQ